MVIMRALPMPANISTVNNTMEPDTVKILQKVSGLSATEQIINIKRDPAAYSMYL